MKDLRIKSPARTRAVSIFVNGREVQAFEGELLHAVLAASGFKALRKSKSAGGHRGFFCGMGVCFECLVTIDGVPGRQACDTEVVDGMRVEIDE